MQILFYLKQWPGTGFQKLKRFCYFTFLQFKRLAFKTKYIAEFVLTDECNLRCKHCYFFKEENLQQSKDLPLSTWENKFIELYSSGIRSILLIGGEPTLRMDLVLLAQRIFPYIDICTNGIVKISDDYKNRIFLSIDGNKEIHDSIRGNGVFQKVIQNYSGNHNVIIGMTISKENYIVIADVLQLAVENKFLGVGFDLYSNKFEIDDDLYITPDIRKKIIETLRVLKKKYPKHLLLSDNAIKWYETADHSGDHCNWRSGTLHFNSSLEEIEACVHYSCSNCGSFCGANGANINIILNLEDKLRHLNLFRPKNKA
ncbi:MAG: radical SAM protein [Bacteroidota bacterium]